MTPKTMLLALAAFGAAAAAAMLLAPTDLERGAAVTNAAGGDAGALVPHEVEWSGYARAGLADLFAHTYETEELVRPLARMGFDVDVPPGTSELRFRMEWARGTPMHLMAHGPHEEGMPTYMGGMPDSGTECLAIPAEGILPGVWKVMAHTGPTTIALDFVIRVETAGVTAPKLLDGPHGHRMDERMEMEMKEPQAC